jgi:hypothetical protein
MLTMPGSPMAAAPAALTSAVSILLSMATP